MTAEEMRQACRQVAITCAHELERNAREADNELEKSGLLSEACIAWGIVARISQIRVD